MYRLSAWRPGTPVTGMPDYAELTTQHAADLMNDLRPHVIERLYERRIQYRMVGTHRRVSATSVSEYLDTRQGRQRDSAKI